MAMFFGSSPNNENLITHQLIEQEIIERVDGNEENKKGKKRKSKVWDEMTKYEKDGEVRALCPHCKKDFDGSSKKGTTHLNNHLKICRQKRKRGEDADKSNKTNDLTSTDVIKETSVMDLIKSCFYEEGWPIKHWNPSVLNSRKVDILQAYHEEKEKLRKLFSQLSCRFSLRIEHECGFYLLTAHYIDENWEPNSKFICFLNGNHGSTSLIEILKELCLDLKIDGNICSIVDSYEEDYDAENITGDVIGEINSWFTQQGSLPFGGFLLSMNRFIWDFFFENVHYSYFDNFWEIHNCVAYVNKTSSSNRHKFEIAVDNVKSMGKKVTSEPLPTNGSSLEHLEIALGYKEAFCELEQRDSDFKKINLTKEKWDEARAELEIQNLIEDVWSSSTTNSATINVYFTKCCDFYMKLLQTERIVGYRLGKNSSPRLEKLASTKQEFIDKYWSKHKLVLVIAAILDPRFKMDIVQLWYNKIYGCDADHYLKKIIEDFKHVYNEYAKGMETSSISYLDAMGRPCATSHNLISPKSELDRYLNEPKFPSVEKFDILAWWQLYSPIFPTLARMARDFLAIPFSDYHSLYCYKRAICDTYDDDKLDDDLKLALVYLLGLEMS